MRQVSYTVMRIAILITVVLAGNSARSEERQLLKAKLTYAAASRDCRDAYLSALQKEVEAASLKGELQKLEFISRHRGELLLGLREPVEFGKTHSKQVSDSLLKAINEYQNEMREARSELKETYNKTLLLLRKKGATGQALDLQKELAAFEKRLFSPAPVDLPRGQEFTVGKWVGEDKQMIPSNVRQIPNELKVDFRDQRLVIWGTGEHDVIQFGGKRRGHLGKAVLFQRRRTARWEQGGYLCCRAKDSSEIRYSIVIAQAGRTLNSEVLNLKVNQIYQWKAIAARKRLQVVVTLDKAEIARFEAADLGGATAGFAATVRSPGQRAELIVSYEDTSLRRRKR